MVEAKQGKMVDFICKQANLSGFSDELIAELHLKFPQSYCLATTMAKIARAVKAESKSNLCILPFCHTVEAEALGGIINLNDGKFGPRAKEYAYKSLEELVAMPKIDFSQGRIAQVLAAGKLLHQSGETVALEVSGLFTTLNSLIEISQVFKAWRKNPQAVEAMMAGLAENIYEFCVAAKQAGFGIISYADPAGSLKIVGPKFAEMAARQFTYPLLKRLAELADENCLLHLCPKTSLILLGLGLAKRENVQLEPEISFVAAALAVLGKEKIIGQACLKNAKAVLVKGNLWSFHLL